MRAFVIVATVMGLAGCASKKSVEVTMMRFRPIQLVVEIESASRRTEAGSDRYWITVRVLQPAARKGAQLHFLVDGITVDRAAFSVRGSRWQIACDEEAFEHEKSIGFSFWSFTDLSPKAEAGQTPMPTSASVTPRAGAGVAPAALAGYL